MSARGAYDQRDQDEKDINTKARDAVYQIARLASYGRYEYHSIFAYPSIHPWPCWLEACTQLWLDAARIWAFENGKRYRQKDQ